MARSRIGDTVRFRLFLVSYAPLWLMLVLRSAPAHHWSAWSGRWIAVIVFAVLAAWSLIDARRLVAGARRTSPRILYFSDLDDQGGNAAGYLATYLLPFIGFLPTGWGDWAAYLVYFAVAAIVFMRTDLTLVNPTLYVMGWRVVTASAYLAPDRTSAQRFGSAPIVVVCRDPGALLGGPVDVVDLGGCYITRQDAAG